MKTVAAAGILTFLGIISAPVIAQTLPAVSPPAPNASVEAKANASVALGLAAYEKGRMDDAIAAFSEAIRLAPKYEEAYFRRGFVLFKQRKRREAAEDFSKVIELNPQNSEGYAWRGISLASLGGNENFERLIVDENRALALRPDNTQALSYRAFGYLQLKRFDAAITDYAQMIRLEPTVVTHYLSRATAYREKDDAASRLMALGDLNQAVLIDKKSAQLYSSRSSLHAVMGNRVAALADADKVAELMPNTVEAINTRGAVFMDLREYAAAAKEFEKAMAFSPKDEYAFLYGGAVYSFLKQDTKALPILKKGIPLGRREDVRNVIRYLDKKVKRDPKDHISDAALEVLYTAANGEYF
jgi:tetratricopeptide (TPR) repeat protein